MFFSAEDDEQDFMSTGGGSKLANLFGMDKASGQGGNSSLTYTAPKEPKKKVEAAPTQQASSTPSVVVACVVQAYKYVDNKYVSQGRLGAALLATHASKDYRILLYVSKQQQVTNAKITTAFAFNIQENNYASFYDDARQTWSLLFDSPENAHKFAKEVAIAKANSIGDGLAEVISQDLGLGDGGPLEFGDMVEVKYSGWLLVNGALNQTPFDSNITSDKLFRFKIGKGKVIKGWDQGMLGLKKGGKRMLVIPPSLGYGAQGAGDRIPPNSTLTFEVEVVRVKLAKGGDSSSQESSAATTPVATPAPTQAHPAPAPAAVPMPQGDDVEEAGVKGRSKSISEQLSQSPNSGKAKLISRMARMGQPMLPFQGAVAAQPEEDEMDTAGAQQQQQQHEVHQPAPSKPSLPTKPTSVPQASAYTQQPQMMAQPGLVGQPMMVGNTPMMAQPMQQQFPQQQQQQPAFLQNLPGAQQLAVYQNPLLQQQQQQQQQQAALLQQQQLLQQQAQVAGMAQPMAAQAPLYTGATHISMAPPTNPVAPPPTSSSTDSLAPVLLTETRQQNTEVRLGISKMAEKVDKILEKVEHMNNPAMMGPGMAGMGVMSPYGGAMPAPSMEANVLMQNITRIVQDNERLKKEVYDQSGKVQEQNEKINTLLEKNQKYVEKSQDLLEQRNEGYKNSASQSQARVLSLEQEKVSLATELSSASAQITMLQLELGEFRKKEGELKQQLQMTSSTGSEAKEELTRLQLLKEENEQKLNTLTTAVRDEKQARKQMEAKLGLHQEELLDLKSTNETLERNLTERKKKAAEERRQLEEDMEDAKINYETTIEGLREKLRRQKTSTNAETESKLSKIEEEISRDWQVKSERMLASATEKHNRQLADVKEEKEELVKKVAELEKKLTSVKSSGSSTEQQIFQLKEEVEEMSAWKGKYDNLRKQASSMKEKYEKRIEELESEKEEEEEKTQQAEESAKEQRQQLLQQIQQLKAQQTTAATPVQSSSSTGDVVAEVKKIMNQVFQSVRGEFDASENYQGSQVLSIMLGIIKQKTLELVTNASPKKEADESEEEEEEEEEEEDEEEEQEESGEEEDKEEEEEEEEKAEEVSSASTEKNKEQIQQSSPESSSHQMTSSTNLSPPPAETTTQRQQEEGKDEPKSNAQASEEALSEERNSSNNSSRVGEGESSGTESSQDVVDKKMGVDAVDGTMEAGSVKEAEPTDEDKPTEKESTNQQVATDESETEAVTVNGSNNNNSNNNGVVNEEEEDSFHSTSSKDESPRASPTPPKLPEDSPEKEAKVDPTLEKEAKVDPTPEKEAKVDPTPEKEAKVDPTPEKEAKVDPTTATTTTKSESSSPTKKAATPPAADTTSREPPPLFDDDDDDEDGSLFGQDSNVADTFGSGFESKPRSVSTLSSNQTDLDKKPTPAKKIDLGLDEDDKPQPPPPLFGDDSDDDDLDWLS